ncbi:MAG: hypothetical protein LBK25_05880 [Treponema sp.]|nr:hypothetical protein [Treponema sp.]
MSDARCQTRGIRDGVSDVQCQTRGGRDGVSETWCQRRGVRRAVLETWCQTRSVRRAVSDAQCQTRGVSDVARARRLIPGASGGMTVSDAWCQTHGYQQRGVRGVCVLGGGGKPRLRGLETGGRTTRATVCHPPFWKTAPPLFI